MISKPYAVKKIALHVLASRTIFIHIRANGYKFIRLNSANGFTQIAAETQYAI